MNEEILVRYLKEDSEIHFEELRQLLQDFIVKGLHENVRNALKKISILSLPRNHRLPLADAAWRTSEPLLALKILHPVIYPKNSFSAAASDREILTYGSALINLGANDAALKIFSRVDESKEPEVLLRKSFAQFASWDYQVAIPYLQAYVNRNEITPYQRLVGRLNLAAAHIYVCEWAFALEHLEILKTECGRQSYGLLLGNTFELFAQVEVFQGQFAAAEKFLTLAEEQLKNQNGDFSMFVEKWKTITQLLKAPSALENRKALHEFKERAAARSQWETLRECDLFEAFATKNEELARHVVMGTPHESYRRRARRILEKNIIPNGRHTLILNPTFEKNSTFEFDPYVINGSGETLFKSATLLKLYESLTVDFYKPNSIGLLFQKIYPAEKFDPFHSPGRVLQLLKRLDKWFASQSIPLRVRLKKSEFILIGLDGVCVKMLLWRSQKLTKENGFQKVLKAEFKDRTFSTQQACLRLKISRRSAADLIEQLLTRGELQKKGSGRSTQYQFSSPKTNRAVAS